MISIVRLRGQRGADVSTQPPARTKQNPPLSNAQITPRVFSWKKILLFVPTGIRLHEKTVCRGELSVLFHANNAQK